MKNKKFPPLSAKMRKETVSIFIKTLIFKNMLKMLKNDWRIYWKFLYQNWFQNPRKLIFVARKSLWKSCKRNASEILRLAEDQSIFYANFFFRKCTAKKKKRTWWNYLLLLLALVQTAESILLFFFLLWKRMTCRYVINGRIFYVT